MFRIDAGWVLTREGATESASVLVDGGAITWVGPTTCAPEADQVVSQPHDILAPGLVDAHTHLGLSFARALGPIIGHPVYDVFWPLERALDVDMVSVFARNAAAEALLSGTTTVADHYFFADSSVEVTTQLGLRSVVGETIIVLDGPRSGVDRLHKGVAFVERHDATPLVHPVLAPHALDTVGDDVMRDIVAESVRLDVPIHLHVAQSQREVDAILARSNTGPIERLHDLGVMERRVVAAHCMYGTETGFRLLAESTSTTAIYCPTVHAHLGKTLPAARLRRAGVAVGLGTDAAPMQRRDLMSEVRTASAVQAVLESDPSALPIGEALTMATEVNATALGLGDLVGSIEVGKRADLVLYRTDNVFSSSFRNASALAAGSDPSTIRSVWVDGDLVVDDGNLVSGDEGQIAAATAAAHVELFTRASLD